MTSLLSLFSGQVPEAVSGLRGCCDVRAGVHSGLLAADTCHLGKVPVPLLHAGDLSLRPAHAGWSLRTGWSLSCVSR